MGFFEDWKAVLMQPKETFAKQKSNASIMGGLKNYLISGAIYGVIAMLVFLIFGAMGGAAGAAVGGGVGMIAALAYIVMIPLGALIGGAILYVIAKLLGGTGDFKTHFYLPSLFAAPMAIAGVFGVIPLIGMLVSFAILLYSLYLTTLAYKEAHGFDTLKAILVWLIPFIIVGVLMLLVFGSIFALMAGAGAARGA